MPDIIEICEECNTPIKYWKVKDRIFFKCECEGDSFD